MATSDAKSHSFFSIYKPGQGKYVRWGTVAGMALIVGGGLWWLEEKSGLQTVDNNALKASILIAWAVLGALLTFVIVNKPNLAEFMIMTESEMRKVTWPTRRQLIASTKVVILLTFILALLLWLVDFSFAAFFHVIGIS